MNFKSQTKFASVTSLSRSLSGVQPITDNW